MVGITAWRYWGETTPQLCLSDLGFWFLLASEVRFRARLDRRICSPRVCCTFDFLPFLLSSYIGGPKHHCWSDTFTFFLAALQPRSFGYKMRSPFCMRNKIKMLPRLPLFFPENKKQGNKTHPALLFRPTSANLIINFFFA